MVRQRAPSQSSTNSSIPERDQVCDSEILFASRDLANPYMPRVCGDAGTRQYVRLSCEDYLAWAQRIGEVSLSLATRVYVRRRELELILLGSRSCLLHRFIKDECMETTRQTGEDSGLGEGLQGAK
jgi:hypothetical protein